MRHPTGLPVPDRLSLAVALAQAPRYDLPVQDLIVGAVLDTGGTWTDDLPRLARILAGFAQACSNHNTRTQLAELAQAVIAEHTDRLATQTATTGSTS